MKAPVYVKIDRYKEVEHTITQIKTKIEEAKAVLNKLNEVRMREENDISAWEQKLTDIEKKVATVQESMGK